MFSSSIFGYLLHEHYNKQFCINDIIVRSIIINAMDGVRDQETNALAVVPIIIINLAISREQRRRTSSDQSAFLFIVI